MRSRLSKRLEQSKINYWSDLFIVAMVLFWIVDNVYESIIATIIAIASIKVSLESGMNCFEVSMFQTIGSNVAIPLASGGAIWMIKNSVQHAIANHNGKECKMDFPKVNAEGEDDGLEQASQDEETTSDETQESFG